MPGLRLIRILGFGLTKIWWRNRTDILLQRLGRVGSMSDLFVHPLSVGSGGCRLARHGMLTVDKTTRAIERNLNRSFLGVRAKVLAWRLWGWPRDRLRATCVRGSVKYGVMGNSDKFR